jgi:2-amino-4-hydroxy-6-hydroxymethyldihydropteridine diphosphokinase
MSNAKRNLLEHQVWIGLGANLGNAAQTFSAVHAALTGVIQSLRVSSLYVTRPYGDTAQNDFTNAVMTGTCTLEPMVLLRILQQLEGVHGKRKLRPNGPRTIDLDILFWGNLIARLPGLEIPHPRATERDFVLIPMQELDPDWIDPRSGKAIHALLANLTDHYFTGTRHAWPS